MKALITGISGFAGGHLAEYLASKKGVRVYGLARRPEKGSASVFACDIRDGAKLEKILRRIKPDRVFHLAAQASVPVSWKDPRGTFEQNLNGTLNLLEAARRACPKALIQLTGSAQEYGIPPKTSGRIGESAPLNPLSPYAVSKAAQDFLMKFYGRRFGMKIVMTRAFNHIGPRQSDDFIASSFAKQIAEIEAGLRRPEILVGDLRSVRDYTDVRDMVRAYWLSLEKGRAGEVYNIASGRGRSGLEILEAYLKITDARIRVKKDPSRMRSHDLPRLVGDPSKFMRRTGWKPEINFEKSLEDILNYWRKEVGRGKK